MSLFHFPRTVGPLMATQRELCFFSPPLLSLIIVVESKRSINRHVRFSSIDRVQNRTSTNMAPPIQTRTAQRPLALISISVGGRLRRSLLLLLASFHLQFTLHANDLMHNKDIYGSIRQYDAVAFHISIAQFVKLISVAFVANLQYYGC